MLRRRASHVDYKTDNTGDNGNDSKVAQEDDLEEVIKRTKVLAESCHNHEKDIARLEYFIEEDISEWDSLLNRLVSCDDQLSSLATHLRSSIQTREQSTMPHIATTREDTNKAYQEALEARARLDEAISVINSSRQKMIELDREMNKEDAIHTAAVQYQQAFIVTGFVIASLISSIAFAWWYY